MKNILIIEDDSALLETLKTFLEGEGFKVSASLDGEEGFKLACKERIDLIILDLVLPSMGGIEVCRGIREKGIKTPIIMLSGQKREEIDKVLGLELGADDYVIKPFGPKELLARIRAVLRRTTTEYPEIDEYSFGNVTLNFKKQVLLKGKESFPLTPKEINLLRLLISNEGNVVSREMILNEVWGYDKFPTTRTVDTFIHNLRQKIEIDPSHPVHLLTVPWAGYKFQK